MFNIWFVLCLELVTHNQIIIPLLHGWIGEADNSSSHYPEWIEHSSRSWKVVGSSPSHAKPKA